MESVNYNGQVCSNDTPLFGAKHRGVRYGDGLFETLRYLRGNIPLLPLHLERLRAGMMVLGLQDPGYFRVDHFEKEVKKLEIPVEEARVRLAVFRKEGGFYTPETDEVEFLLEWSPISNHSPIPSTFIPQSGFLTQYPLTPNLLSAFKTANSLPYILASRFRKVAGWEEGVMLNQAGRVADGCHSNIFAVKKDSLFTPPVQEGALAGVMRSVILQLTGRLNIPVFIQPIAVHEWLEADEIWFTNAVSGMRWVHIFENRRLENTLWREFFQEWEGLWKDGDFSKFNWINH